MRYSEIMSKIRYWDNKASKWMIRHFYIMFFEILLVFIFVALFVITLKAIDLSLSVAKENAIERLLMIQTFSQVLIILLLLLNSFWMLYVFNGILRIRSLLRELNFNISRKPNR